MTFKDQFETEILSRFENPVFQSARLAIRDMMGEEFPITRESLCRLADIDKARIIRAADPLCPRHEYLTECIRGILKRHDCENQELLDEVLSCLFQAIDETG